MTLDSTTRSIGRATRAVASILAHWFPGLSSWALPPASLRRRAYEALMRRTFVQADHPVTPFFGVDETPDPVLSPAADPLVSIVVSSFGSIDYTLRCLASIGRYPPSEPYEVIVVDDASPPADQERLRQLDGIQLRCLERNRGYLRATNEGMRLARGDLIILLNNDVQVTDGALDAMVERARSQQSIGIVGARLIYPQGRLQEAGGIVFRDGSAWNYGNREDPGADEFLHAREVDYCSAACLLIRRDLVTPLFDERFAPAFYEDTDLCFTARSAGAKVVYEPRAVIFHHEGISHGTDMAAPLKAFQAVNRATFVEKWEVALRSQCPPDASAVGRARDRRPGPHVIVTDHRIPTPDRDAGSVRLLAIIDALQRAGMVVHFVPADWHYVPGYTEALRGRGVEVLLSRASLKRHLRSLGADIRLCIISRPHAARLLIPTLRRSCPNASIVYDMVDFHALRDRRMQLQGRARGLRHLANRIARLERWAIAHSDATIAITDVEASAVADRAPGTKLFVLPTIHHVPPPTEVGFDARSDLVFVGSFEHAPNIDAVSYICDELAPRFARELPDARIWIVGADPPRSLTQRPSGNVTFLGWVPDLEEVYARTRVAIAPLRAGAGMKGKIGEAMAHSLPVVTTPIGIEGFDATPGTQIAVANDPDDFVAAAARLYRDKAAWLAVSTAGREFVQLHYSTGAAQERVNRILLHLGVTDASPVADEHVQP